MLCTNLGKHPMVTNEHISLHQQYVEDQSKRKNVISRFKMCSMNFFTFVNSSTESQPQNVVISGVDSTNGISSIFSVSASTSISFVTSVAIENIIQHSKLSQYYWKLKLNHMKKIEDLVNRLF